MGTEDVSLNLGYFIVKKKKFRFSTEIEKLVCVCVRVCVWCVLNSVYVCGMCCRYTHFQAPSSEHV